MAVTAWKSPTVTVTNNNTTTPDNIFSSDDARVIYDVVTDWARYGTFGDFAIPAGMGIVGIEAEIEGTYQGAGVNRSVAVDIKKSGSFQGNKSFSPSTAGTDNTATLGGSTDQWGAIVPVRSDFDNGTFEIEVGATSLSVTSIDIDFIRLRVYYAPLITITGTLGTTPSERDIRNGGKTIILTLSGDTWQTAGANFDAIRDDIINGFDSGGAEAGGWDAIVKAGQSLGGVVRTSDTVVTITLDAFPNYLITANETITPTIPVAAIQGADAPTTTPSPAFTVSNERFRPAPPNNLRPGIFTPSGKAR